MARPPSTRGSPVPAAGGEASQECGKGRAKRLANPPAKALVHRADDKQAKILKARYHYTAQAGQGRPISGPAIGSDRGAVTLPDQWLNRPFPIAETKEFHPSAGNTSTGP